GGANPSRAPRSALGSRGAANGPLMWRPDSAGTASWASAPATRSRTSATSRTDFAIGPTASLYGLSGMTPARLVRPRVVRIVESGGNAAGFEGEVQVWGPRGS